MFPNDALFAFKFVEHLSKLLLELSILILLTQAHHAPQLLSSIDLLLGCLNDRINCSLLFSLGLLLDY